MTSSNKTRPIFMVIIIILSFTGLQAARADEQQSSRQGITSEIACDNASATENECRMAIDILDKMIKSGDADQAALEMREEASRQLKQLQKASRKIGHSIKVSR